MKLFENRLTEAINIYKDDSTGDIYIYDGKELVKVGNMNTIPEPDDSRRGIGIGDMGSEEDQQKAKEWREAEIEKEKQEHPELYDDDEEEESEEEKEERLKRIKNMLSDESTGKAAEEESSKKINREMAKKKAAKEKDVKQHTSDIKQFPESLKRFIADQLKKIKQKTWKVTNPRYEGSGIMRRGTRKVQNKVVPVINVYFDQSGSWGPADIKVGEEAIGILNNYVKRGEIKINVYYFGNWISDSPNNCGGGTAAGKELIEHIQATKPTNVIVMTDDDFDHWDEITEAPNISVPGAVWFLFRNGLESKRLQAHLKGRSQTQKFYF